ncbi:hypothetical protein [Deinococcus cellulosilyticus]|uniref:Uncharacterized protein n=1 Tax=Deinococcus cellulosilyticus (strain DSM 18568 / NBRC 106333 / KACC 11606 / 5516J-15) TaxID=1223518 RepID=A0A511MXM0_DEIC1|nr:hypothetical protein [Deinococcus cellulosilyticus]GEM45334.1 hypothetical protein DC3_09690 [Deinococcus cellulosilyticus NBRC 106333 = KACC 11606]
MHFHDDLEELDSLSIEQIKALAVQIDLFIEVKNGVWRVYVLPENLDDANRWILNNRPVSMECLESREIN